MELDLNNINKKFKDKVAVKEVNVHMKEGVHALLGANGSGKTTLMRIICGVLPSDSGDVKFDEIEMTKQYRSYASILGYMPQHFGFYPNYSVYEFLDYMAVVKGLNKEYREARIATLLNQLNLVEIQKKKMKMLSGGMLRRVGIAQALLNDPKILILDEPTAGLDPKERIAFRNLIASLSEKCIILLSTHIVSDIETIADDILVMKEGEILFHDTPEKLLSIMKNKVWELSVDKMEARKLMQNYIVVKSHFIDNMMHLRLISDTKPFVSAISVKPDLDDLYLYYFQEEVSL